MESYTRLLAKFAALVKFEQIPPEVIEHAKVCLLDTIGCGLFGSTLQWSHILEDTLLEFTSGGPCKIWGTGRSCAPAEAALINGSMVHGFELDDLHKASIVHTGSVVTPPALAVAEYLGDVTGKEFLTAMVVGYEVAARVGKSMGAAHLLQGWHPTGTHGTFGSAAAAGLLLHLSVDQMHNALGIAGTQASGLMAAQYSSMVKRFHAGRAAQSGVYSAFLARKGYTGILELFESEYGGYCTTLSPKCDREQIIAGLGYTWETLKVGFKPYSTNGSCHTTIDALLELIKIHSLCAEDVEKVRVYTSSATKEHVGWQYSPNSITTAQMNLPYIAAVTLVDHEAFVDQFTEERIRDEHLVALADQVEVIAASDIDARGDASRHAIRLEVYLHDGRILKQERQSAKGSSAIPLSKNEVENKFSKLAVKVLSPGQVEQLMECIYRVDTLDTANQLTNLIVPQ